MKIMEIFESIQGEGHFIGMPVTFVRLAGCNRQCTFCDTPEALDRNAGRPILPDDTHRLARARHLTVTGGEPLIQAKALVECLQKSIESFDVDRYIQIETNGDLLSKAWPMLARLTALGTLWITCSPKTEAAACHAMQLANEMKLVIGPGSIWNIERATRILRLAMAARSVHPLLILQPETGINGQPLKDALDWCHDLSAMGNGLRVIPQVHRLVGWK